MGRSTLNHLRDKVAPLSLLDGARREMQVVTLNVSNTGAFNRTLVRFPTKAQVTAVRFANSAEALYHAAAEADTWIFNLVNASTAATLNAVAASMSGQTLAATSYKVIPVDNGQATFNAGGVLQLQLSVSGAPQTLDVAQCEVEWVPLANT